MTNYVVDRLSNELKQHQIVVDCFQIEVTPICNIVLSDYDAFGIAYPVHSFNAPELVVNFVKQLPESSGMDTFIIHTAGEENKVNYASSDLLIKKLNNKGYQVFYNKLIEMPSNFIIQYDVAKVNRILGKANKDIPHIAKDIMEITPYFMRKSLAAKILAVVGRTEWYGAHILGKFFYTKSGCTRCKTCVNNCPNQNIVMDKKSVRFRWHCGMCMRCIYQCPKNVISIHQPFRFIRFDQWYDSEIFKYRK